MFLPNCPHCRAKMIESWSYGETIIPRGCDESGLISNPYEVEKPLHVPQLSASDVRRACVSLPSLMVATLLRQVQCFLDPRHPLVLVHKPCSVN